MSFRKKSNKAVEAHEYALQGLDCSIKAERIASKIAPILCAFVCGLKVNSKQYERIWFMARDGFLPKKMYDILCEFEGTPSDYLYVSRKSVNTASSKAFSIREINLAYLNSETRNIRAVLKPLRDAGVDVDQLLKGYDVNPKEEFYPMSDAVLHSIIRRDDVRKVYNEYSSRQKRQLLAYLQEINFLSQKNIAVVDVGWGGQIQESLELVLRDVAPNIGVNGMYMALNNLSESRKIALLKMTGLIHDSTCPNWKSDLLFSAVDLFEDVCRSHEGTVIGYEFGKPILDNKGNQREVEINSQDMVSDVQNAIIEYAYKWMLFNKENEVTFEEAKDHAVDLIVDLMAFPSREMYDFFQKTSTASKSEKYTDNKSDISFLKGLKDARWTAGFLSQYRFGKFAQYALLSARLTVKKLKLIRRELRNRF